jgi:hypothetical protein
LTARPRAILRVVCAARWNDGEEAGHGMGYPEMRGSRRIACFSSGSFYLFLSSICQCLFVILFLWFLRRSSGCGEVLYIRGVDRLDEKNKHKHFYLSTRVPNLREYHLLSENYHTLISQRSIPIEAKRNNKRTSYSSVILTSTSFPLPLRVVSAT